MPLTDPDLELLENYLDEALAPDEIEPLHARLATDPELAATLKHLRDDRALRRSVFTAFEPDPAGVDAFAARVRQATTAAPTRRTAWLRPLRYATAAAALVAVGFFSRSLLDRPATPDAGNLTHVTRPQGVDVQKVNVYQVTLRDDAGRVVAVQRFDSIDKAQEFAADLSRWQSRNERLASNRFIVTADRF